MTILFIIVAPNKYPEKIPNHQPFSACIGKILQQKAGEKPKKNKWKNRRTGKRENLALLKEVGVVPWIPEKQHLTLLICYLSSKE